MQLATIQPQNMKVGCCPHGLPAGACPICSGMGGGAAKKADFSAKPGEMSWNECAAIGAFLKAQKAAQQAREADFQKHVQTLQNFQKTMANASQKAVQFAQMVQNSLPAIIAKPIAFVANNIIASSLNFIQNIPTNIANFVNNITEKLADVASKLTAVYGELKAAISEKLAKPIASFKEKIKSLFKIFKSSETEDEDKKVDEAKRTFELKTFIHKLYRKLKQDAED